jgi:excisionase family DNA binding protein
VTATVEQDRFVSTRAAAEELGVSISTIRRLVRAEELHPVRFGERGRFRFRRREVLALLEPKGTR